MAPLLVAAGGGGDVIAAALLSASRSSSVRPVIATWGWERLMIDPVPGPRGFDDFDGLSQPAPGVHLVTPLSCPRPPAHSTLPRLAAELDADLVLLDASHGCAQLAAQLRAAAEWVQTDRLEVVDVGGDILARPGDPGVRSPLADLSILVAAHLSGLPGTLSVLGLSCDGELSPDLLRDRLSELKAVHAGTVNRAAANRLAPVLQWHPSEATALVVMAALGCQGTVEIRDSGLPVTLDETTPTIWQLGLDAAMPPDDIVQRIAKPDNLRDLEVVFTELFGTDEIGYERRKANAKTSIAQPTPAEDGSVAAFLQEAHHRGIDWVTRRRIREATGLNVPKHQRRLLLVPTSSADPYRDDSERS